MVGYPSERGGGSKRYLYIYSDKNKGFERFSTLKQNTITVVKCKGGIKNYAELRERVSKNTGIYKKDCRI